jgi:lysophospholipase L1-like esterase
MEVKKIILMGDSITEDWSLDRPEFFESNKNFINKGVGGQTTVEMLLRFENDVIDLKPAAVFILAGINDIAQNSGYISLNEIALNITKMGLIAKSKNIKVIVSSVLPASEIAWNSKIKNVELQIVDLNLKLFEASKTNGFVYLDLYSSIKNDLSILTYDGLHPNKNGYLKMEPILINAFESLFIDSN